MGTTTQKQKILDWMMKGYQIDTLDALNMFGCMRLSARIADLKLEGYPIQSSVIGVRRKDGTRAHVAMYYIDPEWRKEHVEQA